MLVLSVISFGIFEASDFALLVPANCQKTCAFIRDADLGY
jgi:hypothetical protein